MMSIGLERNAPEASLALILLSTSSIFNALVLADNKRKLYSRSYTQV